MKKNIYIISTFIFFLTLLTAIAITKEEKISEHQLNKFVIDYNIQREKNNIKWIEDNSICYIKLFNSHQSLLRYEKRLGNAKINNCFKINNLFFYSDSIENVKKYFGIMTKYFE